MYFLIDLCFPGVDEHAANGKDLHLTDDFRSQLEIVQLELASEREKVRTSVQNQISSFGNFNAIDYLVLS